MSTFAVKATRIRSIEPIEGADMIELAVVGDYRSVVRKGDYKSGQLAVYIPEGAVLPEWLIERMGLTGKLAGKQKNRVKAVRLRGCLSQGLLYPVDWMAGQTAHDYEVPTVATLDNRVLATEDKDVAEALGIIKYEPPIPAYMSGEVYAAGLDVTVKYDIDNFKAFPDVLVDGEQVSFTEKLHGTFCGIGILPTSHWDDKHVRRKFVVFSKGLGGQGHCFKDTERNWGNVYFRALTASGVFERLETLVDPAEEFDDKFWNTPVFILGEVYGKGIQDLAYGMNDIKFRVFDIAYGYRSELKYVCPKYMRFVCENFGLDSVPVLYEGPFSKEVMLQHTKGWETVSGGSANIREGIVIRPTQERYDPTLGRVILKSVSDDYLLRKGEITEYQ